MDLPAILDDSFVSQKRYGTEGMKIILMESEGEREREKKRKEEAVSMLEFPARRRSCGAERKGPDAAA